VSKLRDVLRLPAAGMSSRQAAAGFTIGATTVIDYLGRARRAGPLPDDLTDETLEPRL
jgi:transposase